MTILNDFNFKSVPGKDFGTPLLVKVVTEIYPVSFCWIPYGWKERLQDTYTLQAAEGMAYYCRWDTTDYESLVGYQPGNRWPILMWKRDMDSLKKTDMELFRTIVNVEYNLPLWAETFLGIRVQLGNLQLCDRLFYIERKVRRRKITVSAKMGRAIRRA